jgi:hypothetical protein
LTFCLSIEQVQPLTGSVTCESAEAVPFAGWLELLGVLSDLLDAACRSAEGDRTPDPAVAEPSRG